MNREPDWASLDEVNFIIHRRLSEHLNAALAAISLIDLDPNAAEDAAFWRERALNEVLKSLHTHTAWASLVRYKQGESFLPQHVRQFRANELLRAVALQLHQSRMTMPGDDILLRGNHETLQEALLLLHTSAYTLGPGVQVRARREADGMWFRVRYDVLQAAPPASLNDLLASLTGNWRTENTAFELRRAADFLAMNGCTLHYTLSGGTAEFAFFVPALARSSPPANARPLTTARRADAHITAMLRNEDQIATALLPRRQRPTLRQRARRLYESLLRATVTTRLSRLPKKGRQRPKGAFQVHTEMR